jgi:hypothetical protein
MQSERGKLKTENGHVTSTINAQRSPTTLGDITVGIVYIQSRPFSNFRSDLTQLFDTKVELQIVLIESLLLQGQRPGYWIIFSVICQLVKLVYKCNIHYVTSCLYNGKLSGSRNSLPRGRLRGHRKKVKIDKAVRTEVLHYLTLTYQAATLLTSICKVYHSNLGRDVSFPQASTRMLRLYLGTGHDRFLAHSFIYIIRHQPIVLPLKSEVLHNWLSN